MLFSALQPPQAAWHDSTSTKAEPDLDPWLNLYTATGTLLWSQDDGGMIDPGSSHAYDSYGTFTFATSGLYVVSVQRWPDLGMEIGQN